MKTRILFYFYILFPVLVFTNSALAQDSIKFFGADTVNVIYFSNTDTLPFEMTVYGQIVDASSSSSCGIFISSGTIKLRIINPNVAYPDSFVYIVANCLSYGDALIGSFVELKVIGLMHDNDKCYHPIFNKFDSNSIPFYWIDSNEREKLTDIYYKKHNE